MGGGRRRIKASPGCSWTVRANGGTLRDGCLGGVSVQCNVTIWDPGTQQGKAPQHCQEGKQKPLWRLGLPWGAAGWGVPNRAGWGVPGCGGLGSPQV